VALKVLEIIERDQLAENARVLGAWFKDGLESLARKYPQLIQRVRGLGLMLGIELAESIPALCADGKPPSGQLVARLQELGVLVIPAGTRVVRFLPPLNLSRTEAAEGLAAVERVLESCV
jgi:acetylornithine/succinyldiaminopimelate/putrescine aminotransferase